MLMNEVFFDVGANLGTHSIPLAGKKLNTQFYAFEPVPVLINYLQNQSKNLNNYTIVPCAVSNYEGIEFINITKQNDLGNCSILDISDNVKVEFPGKDMFDVIAQVPVRVIRLDNFIEQNDIRQIDYFHCDTQGSDLNVLRGLGKYLSIIKEGVIEAALKKDVFYVGQHTVDEAIDFLKNNNFEILSIDVCAGGQHEADIHFRRF